MPWKPPLTGTAASLQNRLRTTVKPEHMQIHVSRLLITYARLLHTVDLFIFVQHLRMVLLFNLYIGKELAYFRITACKYIGIVFGGYQFLCSDAVRRQEAVILFVLGIGHLIICPFGIVAFSSGIIAVTGRNCAL